MPKDRSEKKEKKDRKLQAEVADGDVSMAVTDVDMEDANGVKVRMHLRHRDPNVDWKYLNSRRRRPRKTEKR